MRRSGRATWAVADQGLSSATNAAVSVLVARSTTTAEFGAFSLAFLIYAILLGIATAVATEPLLVKHAHDEPSDFGAAARAAMGATLALGLAFGCVGLAAAVVVPRDLAGPLTALAVSLPGLLLHDAVRHACFTRGAPRQAFVVDAGWAALQAFGFVVAFGIADPSPAVFVLVWGAAATSTAAVWCVWAGLRPSIGRWRAWVHRHRVLGRSLAVDFLVMTGAGYAGIYAAGAVAGLSAVAAFRGAALLFGPLAVVTTGLRPFVLREQARERGGPAALRTAVSLASALAAAGAAWGALVLLLPDRAGTAVLGDTWDDARRLVPFMAVATAARGLATSPYWGLRALAAGNRIVRARVVDAALTVAAGVAGALAAGALGAAAGMAAANSALAAVWWSQFIAAQRQAGPVGS